MPGRGILPAVKTYDTKPIPQADADRMVANAHALLAAVELAKHVRTSSFLAGQTFDVDDLERAVPIHNFVDVYLTTDNRYLAWSPGAYCDITEAVLAILETP